MASTDELFDELMRNCKKPEDLIGENGLLKQLLRKASGQPIQTSMTDQPKGLLHQHDSGGWHVD